MFSISFKNVKFLLHVGDFFLSTAKNNGNTKSGCKTCSKLAIKTQRCLKVVLVSSLLALTNFALFSNTSNLEFGLVNAGRVLIFPEEYNYLQDRSP